MKKSLSPSRKVLSFEALGQKLLSFLGERTHDGHVPDSHTLQNQADYLRVFGLDSLLPYRSYDRRTQIFHNEKSHGFIIETYPMVGCTEEMQREISGLFQHTLKEKASLQFLMYGDPRIESILDPWAHPLQNGDPIFQKLVQKRTAYLKQMVSSKSSLSLPLRNYRCLISYSEPGSCEGPVEEMALVQTREQIVSALKILKVPVKVCAAQDLLSFIDNLINFHLSTDASLKTWNPYESLNSQVSSPQTHWTIEPDILKVGVADEVSCIKTYTMAREPDYWSLHAMGELIGDPYRDLLRVKVPFLLHYGLTICDQAKTSLRIQSREDWVEKQSYSKIGKRIPIIKSQSKELSFVREQRGKGERFIESRLSVSLLAPQERLIEEEHTLKSLFRSKRWDIQSERYLQLQTYLSTFPMMWGEGMNRDLGYHRRLKTTLTSEAANLLPIQGEWKGNAREGMMLIGRRGQVFVWNPFSVESGNYNVSVVGRSGSGKSVFMQELVTMALGSGAQVFIIDVGRSFEKTVKLLGGIYLEFTPHSPLCLNPFSHLKGSMGQEGQDLPQDFLSLLKPIVSLMAAPQDGTNDAENALIERAILDAWHVRGRDAGMDTVIACLKEIQDPLAQNLANKLFPYSSRGTYGRYFNGKANVDLTSSMVVVELEELKDRKDLQSVILQVMILQITHQLYLGNRQRATYLVLDEAWDLLRARQAGVFIETAARRFRKYKGSLVVGTQSVHDFYASPGAQAAFDNSDWLCMLSQKKESIEQLKKSDRLVVDPGMEEMLNSLKTESGAYAEVMIRGAHGYAIGRLVLDPFSNKLYTTKADEFAAIQHRVEAGQTLLEALEDLSRERAA